MQLWQLSNLHHNNSILACTNSGLIALWLQKMSWSMLSRSLTRSALFGYQVRGETALVHKINARIFCCFLQRSSWLSFSVETARDAVTSWRRDIARTRVARLMRSSCRMSFASWASLWIPCSGSKKNTKNLGLCVGGWWKCLSPIFRCNKINKVILCDTCNSGWGSAGW